jgi:glycosyltransferase involved in cell wall biosynthesis
MSQLTKKELSILIPNYNNVCVGLVEDLLRQAEPLGIPFEIIVADDASTDNETVKANQAINELPYCRYIIKEQNTGSAATRNFLAQQSQYQWLLFLDADILIPESDFIRRYLENDGQGVVNGGIRIVDNPILENTLRYRYERQAEPRHTADLRQQNKYREFRSTNFLIAREAILRCAFDKRFKHSGYEDVMFGKQLRQKAIPVVHISNPVLIEYFEDNSSFIGKTEQQLRTLHTFRDELRGYSRLITFAEGIHIPLVRSLICIIHKLFGPLVRRMLCGGRPSVRLYTLYKLGYYLTLK